MIIGFVEPHLELFGGIRRIVELANRLVDRGHEVTIFHPRGTPCAWMPCRARVRRTGELEQAAHDVLLYNDPNPEDYRSVRRARAALKVFLVLELYETRLLTGFHPALFLPRHQRTRYMRKSLRRPYLKLTNATWLMEWLREHMGLESTLMIGGVNREMFRPVEVDRPGDRFRLLCSGDPRERKGTTTIRRAVELARREVPQLELFTYHGAGIAQERMAHTYCSADLFVEASWQAGWNNPVVEAMACGVPVVCTDIGGVRDFAHHERTAWLVPPRDERAMARAIVRLAGDADLRRRLSARALREVRRFDWDASVERLERTLQQHLEQGNV